MIKVEHLTKKYGDFIALRDVSFELKEGEVVGLLGPNGAGKTTLLRILVSFLKPSAGEVEIEGMDVNNPLMDQKIKSKIGYLPEQAPLYEDMLVVEYLGFIGRMQGISEEEIDGKVKEVIKKCALSEKKNAEISTLSKGYRQRVGIAQALIHNPRIIILDEPTTGLDPKQRIEIRDLIKEIGKDRTIILSSHILSEVRSTCSRVIIINRGKIVADGVPEDLEKEGKANTLIKIEVRGESQSLEEKLQSLDGVIGVKFEGKKIDIEVLKETDIRAEVARTVVESGAGLLALEKQETSLEDIFINLTDQGNE
ncbi:MAG: ATP-binding cassette domain-containing protein [Candidatus Pacebacteria bacterium]|nr:ATP-binding cassette domain-containing protein [Candidatus Paceibacterota bacterium]